MLGDVREGLRRAVGSWWRRLLVAGPALLGVAVAVLVAVAGAPQDRTLPGALTLVQSVMSVLTPLLGVVLIHDLRRGRRGGRGGRGSGRGDRHRGSGSGGRGSGRGDWRGGSGRGDWRRGSGSGSGSGRSERRGSGSGSGSGRSERHRDGGGGRGDRRRGGGPAVGTVAGRVVGSVLAGLLVATATGLLGFLAGLAAATQTEGAGRLALASVLVQCVALITGTGLALLIPSRVLAYLATLAIPLGLWRLFGSNDALESGRG